jgi:flavodoxin I
MRSLIIFSSQSGNTRKLAETVADVLPGEKELVPIEAVPENLDAFDLLAVGFWLMDGKPDPKCTEFLPRTSGKKLFLFATHGAGKGSAHAAGAMEQARKSAAGAHLVGSFSCQGEVQAQVIAKASAKQLPPVWVADAPAAKGHPDRQDLAELRQVVLDLI